MKSRLGCLAGSLTPAAVVFFAVVLSAVALFAGAVGASALAAGALPASNPPLARAFQSVSVVARRIGLGSLVVDKARRKAIEGLLTTAGSDAGGRGPGQPAESPERSWRAFLADEPPSSGHLQVVFTLSPPPAGAGDAATVLSSRLPAKLGATLLEAAVPGTARDMLTLELVRDLASRSGAPLRVPVVPSDARERVGSGLFFEGDVGVLFVVVRPGKAPVFESVIDKVGEALASSQDVTRRRQAAGWRIYRATELRTDGSTRYVFWIEPPVPQADYSLSKLLVEAFGEDGKDQYDRLREALMPGGSRLTLREVSR